ncbi:MAG: cupin domain-containing protein [Candidatus Abyssobacteria bacterium SURF_17]|jgi:quercetin dioxygenase-like cupin family protein|uniref:Cupin domain-containing protein n=1 Tax=Candidatus Abyssobacteria bacterium SURF_17 TaxID=2093361 RepID=A0A419EW49_9BACT|nr:MAG: cupin domain-containing protein [Candidatus Abyssubacteria bacterium SURF_17]
MKIADFRNVELREVKDEGAQGVSIRWVISKEDGAEKFYMRVFDVQPGGHTPYHKHPWEHEVFILEGSAVVVSDKGRHNADAGSVVFLLPEEQHQFRNETDRLMRFICLIPKT